MFVEVSNDYVSSSAIDGNGIPLPASKATMDLRFNILLQ